MSHGLSSSGLAALTDALAHTAAIVEEELDA